MAKGTAYGVTGTSRLLKPSEIDYVHKVVKRAVLRIDRKHNKLISGCAFGVDTEAMLAIWGLIPPQNMICVVPGTALHNYGLVERATEAGATIIVSPNRYTVGETYLARDDVVAGTVEILLSFPQRRTPYRSGTWATINRARKAGKKIRLYPFNEFAARSAA